jgi:site-specific DNA recombinase
MKIRMAELAQQKSEITARLELEAPPPPEANPNIAGIYRRNLVHLTDALNDPQTNQEASIAPRSLISDIVLTPGAKRGKVHATLSSALMSNLEFAAEKNAPGTALSPVITNAIDSRRNQR